MGRRTHSGNPSLRTDSSSSSSSDDSSRTLRSILTAKLARGVIESLAHVMVFESSCSPADQTRSFEETMTRMIDRFDSKDVRVQRALSRLLKIFWVEQKRIDAALHSFSTIGPSGSTSTNRTAHDPVILSLNRSSTHLPSSNQNRATRAGDTTTNPLMPPHRFIPLVNRGSSSRPSGAVSFLDRTRPRSRPTISMNGPTFSDFFSENDDDEIGDVDEFGLREEADPIDLISDPTGDHRTPVGTGLDSHHWGFAPEDEDDDENQDDGDIDHDWVHTGNADEDDSEEDEDEDEEDDDEDRPSASADRPESHEEADGTTHEPPRFSRARRFANLLQPGAGLRTDLLRTAGSLGIRASSRDPGSRRLGALNYIIGDEDENEEDDDDDDNDDDEDGADGGLESAIGVVRYRVDHPYRTIAPRTRQTLSSRPNTFVRPRRAPPGPTASLEEHYQYASYVRDLTADDGPSAISTIRDSFPPLSSSSWMSIIQQLAPTSIPPLPPSPQSRPVSLSSILPPASPPPASNIDNSVTPPTNQLNVPAQPEPELVPAPTNPTEPSLGSEERNEFEDASAERRAQSRVGRDDQVRS